MGSKHFENRARREWWSLHIEAWRRSGLGIRKYCQQQRLTENTLRRWPKRLAGNETALKLEKYQTELRRERAREEREGAPKAEAAQVHDHLGCTQSSVPGVLGDACRGAELERNGAPRLRHGDATVAAFAANDAADWPPARSRSIGAPIFIPPPVRLLALGSVLINGFR